MAAQRPRPSGSRPPASCASATAGSRSSSAAPDGRRLVRVRGDDAHPISQGYACEKPSRLDFYQNGPHRLTKPLRRRADGTLRGDRLGHGDPRGRGALRRGPRRARRRVDLLLRRRRPGQPPARRLRPRHARGARHRATSRARSRRRRPASSGSPSRMLGGYSRGDFEHCEVALFLGKNPWFSHSIPRARVTLREIANDPERCLIVVDPRRTETAEIADIHLQVKPGARRLPARGADRRDRAGGPDRARLARRARRRPRRGAAALRARCRSPTTARSAACPRSWCARRRAGSPRRESVATFEDLGVQMNRHSTLVSYLHKLLVLLTGNFGKKGAAYRPTTFVPLASGSERGERRGARR